MLHLGIVPYLIVRTFINPFYYTSYRYMYKTLCKLSVVRYLLDVVHDPCYSVSLQNATLREHRGFLMAK